MRILFYILTSALSLTAFNSFSQAQNNSLKQPYKFEYYISLSGVNERNDVLQLQEMIQKKQGVIYFMAERFPVRCFVMRSVTSIRQSDFSKWLPVKYSIISYGEGDKAREAAYRIYNQNKNSKH